MTNGEMMQKIFPDMEIEIGEIDAYVWINHEPSHFDKTWWNAEYKEPNCSEIPTGSTDCISRQAVIDLMMQKWGENFSGDSAMQESIDAIRVMSSVTPQEPRKGHWIYKEYDEETGMKGVHCCSECGYPLASPYISFCSVCGADMSEVEE